MEEQNKECSISITEDLDPEPERQSTSRPNLEVALGLLLLLGVLGWALWTWWHDTNVSQHYQQAQQAASAFRWDDALANYSAASGYMDADARAVEAAGKVNTRNIQYQTVVTYQQALAAPQEASPKAAVEALLAARAVQTIEPGYKDTSAIIAQAEEQLFTDALSGTVLMREQATPPGLYYRGPGGWLYMQGSDKESQVWDTVGDTYIAYDAPDSYTTPTATITPVGINDKSPGGFANKTGRHIVLAKLSTDYKQVSTQNLNLSPTSGDYQDRAYVFVELGVWALSRYGVPGSAPGIGNNWNYGANSFTYEAYGGNPVTGTVALKAKDLEIVDLGRKGSTMLIAAIGQMVNNKLTNQIYTAGPDGTNVTALYSTTGTLMSAVLSPDEQYAVVVSAEQDGAVANGLAVRAHLFDLKPGAQSQSKKAPMIVAQTVVTGTLPSGDLASELRKDFHLGAVFLADGAFKNKLLLGWVEGNSIRLRLVDPSNAQVPLAETSVGYLNAPYYRAPVSMQAVVQSDGRTLLVYNLAQPLTQASNAPGAPFTTLVKVFRAQGQTANVAVSDYTISLPQNYVPADKVPYLSDIVFSNAGPVCEITTGMDNTIYSLPANGPSEPTLGAPTRVIAVPLYSLQVAGSPVYWLKGPRALAYLDNANVLHVRPYNAETDVTLENGVNSMVSSHSTFSRDTMLR